MANQFLASWDLAGVVDNFQDFVDQTVPKDITFTGKLVKVPHKSNSFRWVQDANDSIGVIGGEQEVVSITQINPGSPEDGAAGDQSERLNYTQIFRKFVSVSRTAAASKVSGRVDETVYQINKATTALWNQIEGTFLSGQNKQAASLQTKGLTDGFSSQLPADVIISGAVDADNVEALTQKLFENGSQADTILCGKGVVASLKHIMDVGNKVGKHLQIMCEEAGVYTDSQGVKHRTTEIQEINSFTDNNGRVYKVIASRYLPEGQAFFYNSEDWAMVEFRPFKITKLDSFGGTDNYLVEAEVGLRHNGRHKSGLITKP